MRIDVTTYTISIILAMTVFVAIIYGICRLMRLDIKLKPLILIAILGIALSFGLIMNNTAIDQFFFLELGLGVLFVSILATCYNRYLVRNDEEMLAVATSLPTPLERINPPLLTEDNAVFDILEVKRDDASSGALGLGKIFTENTLNAISYHSADNLASSVAGVDNDYDDGYSEAFVISDIEFAPLAESPVDVNKEDNSYQGELTMGENASGAAALDAIEDMAAVETEEAPGNLGVLEALETVEAFDDLPAMPDFASLDELLDFAHINRSSEPRLAISALEQAIESYQEDSYIPFVIIELVNICRNTGDYERALNTLAEAQKIPLIKGDINMSQEFTRNTIYLSIVYDILKEYQSPRMPYPDIPTDIMSKVEARVSQ